MSAQRKGTKFTLCATHAWLAQETRTRRAEFFCEGGPTRGACAPSGLCRIWPGMDIFVPEICTIEAGWPAEWAINRDR